MLVKSKYAKLAPSEVHGFFKNLKASEVKKSFNRSDFDTRIFDHLPLIYAVNLSQVDVVIELIKMGNDAFFVDRNGDLPIADAISSNRPFSDIMRIAQNSKKINWELANFRCLVAAGGRPDSQMLRYLNELNEALDSTNLEGFRATAMSQAIAHGPVENVKYLHELGCKYPNRHRSHFYFIFEPPETFLFNKHKWSKSIPNFNLADLNCEPWSKIRYMLENRIIYPSYLRDRLKEVENISEEIQVRFWKSLGATAFKYEIRVDSSELSALREISDIEIKVVARERDKRTKLIKTFTVQVTESWLLDKLSLNSLEPNPEKKCRRRSLLPACIR